MTVVTIRTVTRFRVLRLVGILTDISSGNERFFFFFFFFFFFEEVWVEFSLLHLPYYYPLSQPDWDEGKRDWLEVLSLGRPRPLANRNDTWT